MTSRSARMGFRLGFFAVLLLPCGQGAFAEPTGAGREGLGRRFVWRRALGAEACVDEAGLRGKVVALLGRDPFEPSSGPQIEGEVQRIDHELVARIELRREDRPAMSREIRAEESNCSALGEAVALAIALAVERGPADDDDSPPPSERSGSQFAAQVDWVTPGPPRRPRFSVSVQAEWTLGWVPRPTTGLGAMLRYRGSGRFSAVAGALFLPSASQAASFSVSTTAGRLGACLELVRRRRLTAETCGYALAGVLSVERDRDAVSAEGSHLWGAGAASASVGARAGDDVVMRIGAEGLLPVVRPTYQTLECPVVGFQQPPVTLGVFVSFEYLFL